MSWYTNKYTFIHSISLPDNPVWGIVYICNEEFSAKLKCPCGCGDAITISTIPWEKPCWVIKDNSISPSIRRTVGCKSHFTITDGIARNHE